MRVIWDGLPSSLITAGTTVEFPTLEPQLSIERLTAAKLRHRPIRAAGGNAYPLSWLQFGVKAYSAWFSHGHTLKLSFDTYSCLHTLINKRRLQTLSIDNVWSNKPSLNENVGSEKLFLY